MRKLPSRQSVPSPGLQPTSPPEAIAHESAVKHVTGRAQYVDDIPEWPNQLHLATGQSQYARARLLSVDVSEVRKAPGVVDVITVDDIPGNPDVAAVFDGDLLLARGEVVYYGQPLFAVAATSLQAASAAVRLATVLYEPLRPLLQAEDALAEEAFVRPTHRIQRGELQTALAGAALQLQAELHIRGQEHFYLEGQVALAVPNEDGGMHVYSSSQHPSEVQKLVASVLALPLNRVQVEVRRMGGGFGGKESQAAALACMAAVIAARTRRPVKYRMPRRDDMQQTGKRHAFWNRYRVGFDTEGRLLAAQMQLAGVCGCSADLSDAIVDRAMLHADNSYHLPACEITGYRLRTNVVSATAFRGFGGPQGMLGTEMIMDDIARRVGKDPLDVRKLNLYRPGQDTTHYGQRIEQHLLPALVEQLEASSRYRERRQAITAFNRSNQWLKKGLALTPVKFGISFTAKHLNQAGALVHIYTDGSIHLNHGGTEMGQGLYTKVAQIVARGLGVDLKRVMVSAARTDKVPNTSPTAASSGTDLNGLAALDAVGKLKQNLLDFAATHFGVARAKVQLERDRLWLGKESVAFEEFIQLAYLHRVSLSASGFYRTPKIEYNRDQGQGRPFFYFANGASVSEVLVDTLTGEYRLTQVDILHDVGESLNPAIDIGQIEGGFVQGLGWLTTEELVWDDRGRLLSNSPANYKIPTAADVPDRFHVALYQSPNPEATVYRSKAVGEPPFMLAISAWCALRDACASLTDYRYSPPLAAPATAEQVFLCLQAAQAFQSGQQPGLAS